MQVSAVTLSVNWRNTPCAQDTISVPTVLLSVAENTSWEIRMLLMAEGTANFPIVPFAVSTHSSPVQYAHDQASPPAASLLFKALAVVDVVNTGSAVDATGAAACARVASTVLSDDVCMYHCRWSALPAVSGTAQLSARLEVTASAKYAIQSNYGES